MKWGPKLMTQIRTGTVLTTNQLVRLRKIGCDWKERCILCGSCDGDHIDHWIFDCVSLNQERYEYLDLIFRDFEIYESDWKEKVLSFILGGELPLDTPSEICRNEIGKKNAFMERLAILRWTKMTDIIKNDKGPRDL